MDMSSSEEIVANSVSGMNYVRPPTLDFVKVKDTKDYTEYEVVTKKQSKERQGDNPFTNSTDSFIYCNDTIKIQQPKKSFMVKKNGKKKFAYAVGMFPNPKNGKAAYLDGCILAALGLKRQGTNADVICFITHDINEEDKKKLEVAFDKVMYVPYISPYDMGGHGDLKTIMMDPKLFDNCPNYTKEHPYVHVFFKLHIFNPKLFPYEKVCFVDSDLVPMNYYDSLFMLDCPAGFVEYRKRIPYLEAFHWDRCDYLEHGKPIPKEITDIDKPTGADVNAGLMLVKPDKKEYDAMIKELTSPLETWMGPDKEHKGFYSFDFDAVDGRKFVENSYCYPEQNYLTKRFSGQWKYIEFSFQSWALDPCNSFGIHMAAFNPKPWFKQPCGNELQIDEKYQPYIKQRDKKNIRIPLAIKEESGENFDNISYSYEMFNEVIIWGMINFPELKDFFVHDTQIHGKKVSFDRDVFKKLHKNTQFKLLKNIKKGDPSYKKLSLSQKYISDLINRYDEVYEDIKDKYLQICKTKLKGKQGYDYDFQIIEYPDHVDLSTHDKKKLLKEGKMPFGKNKGTPIEELDDDYVEFVLSTIAYKKEKEIRKAFQKYHKELIQELNDEKLGKKKKRSKRKRNKSSKSSKRSLSSSRSSSKSGGRSRRPRRSRKPKRTIRSKKKRSKDNTLYFFTMIGCPYCDKFSPTWDKLTKKYGKHVHMKKVERSEDPDMIQRYGVQSFPTIILEKKDKIKFEGERSEENFKKFLKKNKVI